MLTGTQSDRIVSSTAADLIDLAARGLVPMLDPEVNLFCCRLKKSARGMEREGISHRYTMMTLLGLHRFEAAGQPSPVNMTAILEVLVRDTSWIDCAGDLGLLLWVSAVLQPDRLPEVCEKLKVKGALDRY